MLDRDYNLFVLVVETGSISAAGRKLGLSPAAASKRLVALEERLGVRLVQRTTRRLSTTNVGQTFYEDARAIVQATDAAEARAAGRAERPSGLLRVSAPTSFGRLHVAPCLPAFLARYPEVQAEILLDDGYTDLIGDRIDVAIRIAPEPDSPTLVARLLAPNSRVLCAAPSYLETHGEPATLDALVSHRLLAALHQSPWRLESGDQRRSIKIESVVATNSSEVVRELCLAGMGVALRSTWDVSHELACGSLRRILPRWQGDTDIAIWAVHPAPIPVAAAVTVFIEHMAAALQPVSG